VRTMDAEGMDFSVLYTGRYAFYGRVGWRCFSTPKLVGRLKPAASERDDRYSIRSYVEQKDAAALLKIYDEFNAGRPATAVRTEAYWRGFVMHRFHAPWRIALAEKESTPVAYTMSLVKDRTLAVQELGFARGHEAALATLLKDAAEHATANGAEEVQLEPPGDPAVVSAASEIANKLDVGQTGHGMIMFLNPTRTFGRLLPELSKRARLGDLRGSAAIEMEVGSVGLEADGKRVTLIDPVEAVDTAKLTQPDVARLVFGIGPVEDAESEMTNGAREFLSALFPLQPFVYWTADKF